MESLRHDGERDSTSSTRWSIASGTVGILVLMIVGLSYASPSLVTTPFGLLNLVLFTVLTGWIAFGFCVAMAGIASFRLHRVADEIPKSEPAPYPTAAPDKTDVEFASDRVALLVPIYNEDPAAVMACVQATAESLRRTGQGQRFDFFILSDTTDPDVWVREEILWSRVRADMEGEQPAIHYRHRVENRGRKAGNIGEFLERWGLDYKYFLILDADSTMDGRTLVELARRMDNNDRLGILQAPPIPEGRESVWARVQQFSARVYGPLFNWGLVAWTGGEGNYWGHNAIIRTRAFLRHCGLSRLPGPEPLGGEVLSHDFVEAALMLRAGYDVRLAADLGGGYEQCPTTIEDHARRDQRWCQGNLQHLRIAVAPAWRPVSRWHFLSGAFSYLASPLWMLFLLSGLGVYLTDDEPVNRNAALAVFAAAMSMLVIPKIVAVMIHLSHGTKSFGGVIGLCISMLVESVVSMAVAPIMMLYHTRFVLLTLMGRKVRWNAQVRTDDGISWLDACRSHWTQTLVGVALTLALYRFAPELLLWASPLLLGLIIAIPMAKWMASPLMGRLLGKLGLLRTPEETAPPRLLRRREVLNRRYQTIGLDLPANDSLFAQVVRDPSLYRLHQSLLSASISPPETSNESTQKVSRGDLRKARKSIKGEGLESIPRPLRRKLLSDADALRQMHLEYWSIGDHAA